MGHLACSHSLEAWLIPLISLSNNLSHGITPNFLPQKMLPRHSASRSLRRSPTTRHTSADRMPWRRAGAIVWIWRPASCASGLRRGSSSMGTNLWGAPRLLQEEAQARLLLTLWLQCRFLMPRANRCHPHFWITPAEDKEGWDTFWFQTWATEKFC